MSEPKRALVKRFGLGFLKSANSLRAEKRSLNDMRTSLRESSI